MAVRGRKPKPANPIPSPSQEGVSISKQLMKAGVLRGPRIITIQTHGLDYWVGQMSLKLKLMGNLGTWH